MGRRKRGLPVSGWLTLDKPLGMTSTQAVSKVRRLLDAQKAGHAGTLDPLATGVLPIALGEATKTVPYLVEADKAYRFTVEWGRSPSTFTAEKAGGTWEISPTKAGSAARTAAADGRMSEVAVVSPSASKLRVERPHSTVKR